MPCDTMTQRRCWELFHGSVLTSGLSPLFERTPSVNAEEPWYSSPGIDPLSSFCHIDFNSLWHNSTSYRPCHLAFLPASWGFSPRDVHTDNTAVLHSPPSHTNQLIWSRTSTRNSPSSPFSSKSQSHMPAFTKHIKRANCVCFIYAPSAV